MLFAVLKIEMKRTCLFPVCFQLSLSCLSLHSGNLHENKPKKDLSSVQSRARRVWPWLQLPQLGPCSSVEPGEPQAVHSPPPAPSLQAVPSCSGTALTRVTGVWPPAAPVSWLCSLSCLSQVDQWALSSTPALPPWLTELLPQAGSARVLPQKPWAKSPCSHLFCWRCFSRCLWHIPPACTHSRSPSQPPSIGRILLPIVGG